MRSSATLCPSVFGFAPVELALAPYARSMIADAHLANVLDRAQKFAVVFAQFPPALKRLVLDLDPGLRVAIFAHGARAALLSDHAANRDCRRAIACRQIATSE